MIDLNAVLSKLDATRDSALARLFELLRIPSVSTDPAFGAHCKRAANWLRDDLASMGFATAVHATAGHPIVLGHARSSRTDAPHVLFYGHYDVQPPDPLDLWTSEPFAPCRVDMPGGAHVVARGAADDKGQVMTFLEACRAFHATGGLPCHVSVLVEGEEETGSPSLPAFIAAHGDELKADVALICDTSMWDRHTPAITTSLRGLVLEEVVIHAASRDLHSGLFGGAAMNPIRVLGRIIGDLHDDSGRVTLSNFYDGVAEPPQEILAQWRALKFDDAAFLQAIGLSQAAGEKGRGVLEAIWARPTCDVNGIVGGYTGKGSKTVLPAQASAKFSFRLVGAQEPARIRESFRAFVRARLPADCRAEFISHGASAALQLPLSSPALTRARAALAAEWGKPAVLIGGGGSIPIVGTFKRDLGMDSLMIGFGLDDDRIHSPNEKYEVSSFQKGARSWARLMAEFAA